MSVPPDARVIHQTKNRVRLKVPEMKGKYDHLSRVEKNLTRVSEIDTAKANPVTGTILILHHADTDNLLRHLENEHFSSIKRMYDKSRANVPQVETGNEANRAGERPGLATTALLLLMSSSIYKVLKDGFSLPEWHATAWYAFNVLIWRQTLKS